MWRDIDLLPKVNTQYDFLMADGTVKRGVMFPNGTFEDVEGGEMPRPKSFRYDDEI